MNPVESLALPESVKKRVQEEIAFVGTAWLEQLALATLVDAHENARAVAGAVRWACGRHEPSRRAFHHGPVETVHELLQVRVSRTKFDSPNRICCRYALPVPICLAHSKPQFGQEDFVVMRLVLKSRAPCVDETESHQDTHVNALIFDRRRKLVERFEPNGMYLEDFESSLLDQTLRDFVFREFGYDYQSAQSYCPRRGYQWYSAQQGERKNVPLLDERGFCSAWTFYWIDQRLSHPEVTSEKLIEQLLANVKSKTGGESFFQFLKKWSQSLFENVQRFVGEIQSFFVQEGEWATPRENPKLFESGDVVGILIPNVPGEGVTVQLARLVADDAGKLLLVHADETAEPLLPNREYLTFGSDFEGKLRDYLNSLRYEYR